MNGLIPEYFIGKVLESSAAVSYPRILG